QEEDQNGDRSQDQEENSQDSKYGKPKWQPRMTKTRRPRSDQGLGLEEGRIDKGENSAPNIRLLWKSTISTPTLLWPVFLTNHSRGGGMSNYSSTCPMHICSEKTSVE
ncbi:hypothetical protein IFM89_016252, partial [Coptis chinensis]